MTTNFEKHFSTTQKMSSRWKYPDQTVMASNPANFRGDLKLSECTSGRSKRYGHFKSGAKSLIAALLWIDLLSIWSPIKAICKACNSWVVSIFLACHGDKMFGLIEKTRDDSVYTWIMLLLKIKETSQPFLGGHANNEFYPKCDSLTRISKFLVQKDLALRRFHEIVAQMIDKTNKTERPLPSGESKTSVWSLLPVEYEEKTEQKFERYILEAALRFTTNLAAKKRTRKMPLEINFLPFRTDQGINW